MLNLRRGRYTARFAASSGDVERAQQLRHRAFFEDSGAGPRRAGLDQDRYDALCRHVLIEEAGALVCCFRLLDLPSGAAIGGSYSAQFYELSSLHGFGGPLLELGRFCIAAGRQDADILRLAWAAVTRLVDAAGVTLLFGCSSFAGADPQRHVPAFDWLRRHHLAPEIWAPARLSRETVAFPSLQDPDPMAAARAMPSLLRSYLAMGGWVSDHAVIDRDLDTLHVFTGVEIAKVPLARARALRSVAG